MPHSTTHFSDRVMNEYLSLSHFFARREVRSLANIVSLWNLAKEEQNIGVTFFRFRGRLINLIVYFQFTEIDVTFD